MWRCLVVVGTLGCGRLDFTPLSDAATDASRPDAAAPDAPAPDPSLVLHLSFEGPDPLRDRSAFDHDGTCTSCPTYEAGPHGIAASFDGTSCVSIADAAPLRPAIYTAMVFVRPRSPMQMSFFGRAVDGETGISNSFELYKNTTSTWIAVADPLVATHATTADEDWHHLAVINDGTGITLYVDGSPVDATDGSTSPHGASDLRIGCDLNAGTLTWFTDGWIDEVRLYDRVLPGPEIAALAALP